MPVNHITLAEQLLGAPLDYGPPAGGKIIAYGPCPGSHLHTTPTGPRHFRMIFDPEGREMPHEHCFHGSCHTARDTYIRNLIRAIRAAERTENGGHPIKHPPRPQPAPGNPQAPRAKPTYNRELAYQVAASCPRNITEDLLRRISPVAIPPDPATWSTLLIDTLYTPGERILIFTNMRSQGQYLRIAGRGNYRLAPRPGTRATPCEHLPDRGPEGIWYLCAPVTGTWQPNPNNLDPATKQPRPGRRHAECCRRYPYAVIESDTLSPRVWLQILGLLQDPIAAIYTSGSKSIHTLIHLPGCTTTAEFNRHRQALLRRLVPVGADPAAITPVRLTRLPGCLRLNKTTPGGTPALQRLLYLNPAPIPHRPLHTMPTLR